jgi:hypothetical protein
VKVYNLRNVCCKWEEADFWRLLYGRLLQERRPINVEVDKLLRVVQLLDSGQAFNAIFRLEHHDVGSHSERTVGILEARTDQAMTSTNIQVDPDTSGPMGP